MTGGTSMGETTLKFVHGLGVVAVTVHTEVGAGDAILAGISGMLNVLRLFLGTPSEPFDGHIGVIDAVLPTKGGFTGNTVRDHPVHT